jgi:acyl-coenzyme A synthetase/AMP-(fatty) acid ligase
MNSISDQLRRSSEFRAAGHWGDDTLVTLIDRWADADPGHPYLSDGVGELTYGAFRAQAWNLAAALAERGVKPGDRVAVQLPNWNEFFLIYAACARLGAVMIPIVVVYRAGEVGFIVENSGAVALITCGEFRRFDHAAMAREVAASSSSLLLRVVVRGEPTDGALSFADLLGADCDPGVLPGLPSADDPHLILYTSGTESRPKGCLHTWNSSSFLPKHAVKALKMDRTDVMFMPAPVTHALGLTLGVMAPRWPVPRCTCWMCSTP